MELEPIGPALNQRWEQRIKDGGAEFVCFVDASALPSEAAAGYSCAALFGKALSREYLSAVRDGRPPKTKEMFNTEHKMDALAVTVAAELEAEGHRSVGKFKVGLLPHKTVALRAGLGFIGKNNLLVTGRYGCGLILGKVLTTAPFDAVAACPPQAPRCGDCGVCAAVCPTNALRGTTWSVTTTRDDMMTRKLCTLCLKCMACCPRTGAYIEIERKTL